MCVKCTQRLFFELVEGAAVAAPFVCPKRASICAALERAGVCLTSLLKRSNKGFFLQFRSLITLNLATGCFRMMKKGCWLPLQVPDPAFHGGILKKRAVGPRSAQGPKTLKTPFLPKKTLDPPSISHACVSARVCEVHTKVVFCTCRRCGGSGPVRLPQACQYVRCP